MSNQPQIIGPDEGVSLPLGTSTITIKLDATATDGRLALLDYKVAPNFEAPQVMHWRTKETQAIYVLQGRIRYFFQDNVVDTEAGTVLHIPEDCSYTWSNPDPRPARMLYVYTPAGLEQFFIDVQQVFNDHPGLSPADTAPFVEKLWKAYGVMK